jgi:hypothetical protein
MKKSFFLILIIFTIACNNSTIKKKVYSTTIENRIDSVLLHLAKKYELEYKLYHRDSTGNKICDSTQLELLFPLVKKVYYKDLGLTFEFRQSIDCHELLEIILCYNDNIICGIPFRDNYYYWRYGSDTAKYNNKLSFEIELNNAIAVFSNIEIKNNKQIDPNFPKKIVQTIMDNLTKFHCREIFPPLYDFETIKKRIQQNKYFHNKECKKNTLSNIVKLEKELKDSHESILLYDFMFNNCIYCFYFGNFAKSGKYVSLKVINKECYFDIIF